MKEILNRIKWEAVATIIIGLTSVFVAVKANNIANLQAEIERNSALPMINVDERIIESTDAPWAESSVIEISNLSGKMNNYQSNLVSFLSCSYFSEERMEYLTVHVPIENYYILGIRQGAIIGIIEKRDSISNYKKVKSLQDEILRFNSDNVENESIVSQIKTVLKITYTDLLNNQQVAYYSIDPISSNTIDSITGRQLFENYYKLTEQGLSINPNQMNAISVYDLLEVIDKISQRDYLGGADTDTYNSEENNVEILKILNSQFLSTISSVVVTLLVVYLTSSIEKHRKVRFSARLLYSDLISIEEYINVEHSSVNLRYSDNWQQMAADCLFLSDDDIKLIYSIYDSVYNFNYLYEKAKNLGDGRKENITSYNDLKNIMGRSENNQDPRNQKYKMLLNSLKKRAK